MANYSYVDYQENTLRPRYPAEMGIRGIDQWNRLLESPSYENLNRLRSEGLQQPPLQCPRVFVSHRQTDIGFARRIAWIATQENFEFWLDAFDPTLTSLPNFTHLTASQKFFLTAAIIEMALINCTHVVAVMTSNTMGTLWVPYEYGRITAIPTVSGRACAWEHANLPYVPEYLLLGERVGTEPTLRAWLSAEYNVWGSNNCSGSVWPSTEPVPAVLP